MNNQIQNTQHESGADLFARLVSQKIVSEKKSSELDSTLTQLENVLMINKLLNIDSKIFPNGLNNKEVIEIYGKVGVGKSELIMHLIARALLPNKWKVNLETVDQNVSLTSQNENIEASNSIIDLRNFSCFEHDKLIELNQMPKVILIESDSKLNMFRLFTILENRIINSISKLNENQSNKMKNFDLKSNRLTKLVHKFIRECLKNLTVYQCYSSEQFILALSACEHFIQSLMANNQNKSVITPIFIDSINSNFEISDRFNNSVGLGDYDHTEKYTVQLIKKLIEKYNVCIIASRSDLRFNQNETANNNSYKKWQSLLNKKVELINKIEIKKQNIENDDDNYKEDSILIKSRILKLIEFPKELKKDKQESQKSDLSKIVKDNINYTIENSGFNAI